MAWIKSVLPRTLIVDAKHGALCGRPQRRLLEKAKVAADIKFNRNTALLSQDDVQIVTRLKGLYPDVATALSSVEAEGSGSTMPSKAGKAV